MQSIAVILKTFCFVAACCFFTVTAFAETAPDKTKHLKIGVLSGLSGAAAKWNRFQNMGITLAKEDLRSKGWEIDLVFEDSKSLGAQAVAAFDKLIDLDRVDAIIADDFGFIVAPLVPRLGQRKKLLVAISLPHDRYCSESSGYFFSLSSQFTHSRKAFERFFEVQPNVKRIALIAFDDPEWGGPHLELWQELAKQRGIEVVDIFKSGDLLPDYRSALTRSLSKRPDAIFIAHEPETFFKAKAQLRYAGFVVSANNILEMLADSPAPRTELEGVYVADIGITPDFRSRFVARFGVEPILEAYAGYESLLAVTKAYENNPTEPQLGMKKINMRV